MSKRYYKTDTEGAFATPVGTTQLPLNLPVAAYYRQSTIAQVGNISTTIQTVDMVEKLKRYGWPEDKIILIDMDKGVSGTTKIDERDGMRTLFDLITERKIGAVACEDEDRLFRDLTQIQVNIFIEACRVSNVLVITPTMVYDFANEVGGQFHARQFRFKSEMAAEYISTVIKGKLQKAKRHLLLEGRWAGAGLPPGFMIDMRKSTPDGSKNENWRRFVPFEPYADIVRAYFQLFIEKGGQIRATVRHIQEFGPWYPDPATCKPPEGFKVVYKMRRYGKGYCPGRVGLVELLTNAAYIGHWTFNDRIVRWNNHQAIVPIDIFMRAFNYLSPVTLEGLPNPHYQPICEYAHPTREEDRPSERPLFSSMITSEYEGERRNVGTQWVKPLKHYMYVFFRKHATDEYVWSRAAKFFDDAVVQLFQQKLLTTFNVEAWEESLATFAEGLETERRRRTAQLDSAQQVMQNLITNLRVLTNQDMVRATEASYEEAKAEYIRLKAELAGLDNETRQLEEVKALRKSCAPVLDNWFKMTRDEKRAVLLAFISGIEANPTSITELRVVVHWRDKSSDELILPRQNTNSKAWLTTESDRLAQLVDQGASALEIAAAFPDRTWTAIQFRIRDQLGKGKVRRDYGTLRRNETYKEYIARINGDSFVNMDSEAHPEKVHRDAPC